MQRPNHRRTCSPTHMLTYTTEWMRTNRQRRFSIWLFTKGCEAHSHSTRLWRFILVSRGMLVCLCVFYSDYFKWGNSLCVFFVLGWHEAQCAISVTECVCRCLCVWQAGLVMQNALLCHTLHAFIFCLALFMPCCPVHLFFSPAFRLLLSVFIFLWSPFLSLTFHQLLHVHTLMLGVQEGSYWAWLFAFPLVCEF